MLSRHVHVIQPYWVGTKDRKSLAIVIPSQIAREQNLSASTVLAVRVDNTKIILKVINTKYDEETVTIPTGESFEASSQQVSSSGAQ